MADNRCDYCGKYEMLPFNCKYCGGIYCSSHRLPEYHECVGLKAVKQGTWKPPVPQGKKAPPGPQRRGRKPMKRIRLPWQGSYAYAIIGLCVLIAIVQLILPGITGMFELSRSSLLSAPWTLVTYMFIHSPLNVNPLHLFFNMLMLFFFGPLLERQIGSSKFIGLYLGSGILAGLVQVLLFPGAVVGASAAIFGVMGVLAILMPNMPIYFVIVPMRMVYAVILFAALDILMMGSGDMVAHAAHLVGLAVGLLFGYLIKKSKGTLQAYWPI